MSDAECSICMGSLTQSNVLAIKIECGHVFHRDCILEWRKGRIEFQCPYCRSMSRDVSQPIFFHHNALLTYGSYLKRVTELTDKKCAEVYRRQANIVALGTANQKLKEQIEQQQIEIRELEADIEEIKVINGLANESHSSDDDSDDDPVATFSLLQKENRELKQILEAKSNSRRKN